ncbi:hypothetical protein [Halobacillus campisalis]|uniref:Uncharacterized protein n=1 Tax=Halobacillus campisalis TaxID=435909 RepID=A0ABW2K738_9BACI|nr:hypothetical protein [Halobacillus campisalis]
MSTQYNLDELDREYLDGVMKLISVQFENNELSIDEYNEIFNYLIEILEEDPKYFYHYDKRYWADVASRKILNIPAGTFDHVKNPSH